MSIVVPQKPAPGKPWVFHPSFLERDSAVDLALLAKGYYIVLAANFRGGGRAKEGDEVYKRMSTMDFEEGGDGRDRGESGESYAWAIANRTRISAIYARNPLMRSMMSQTRDRQPGAPGQAGVPILHDCGSLDRAEGPDTGGGEAVQGNSAGRSRCWVTEGEGHFPVSRKDPKPCGFHLEPPE